MECHQATVHLQTTLFLFLWQSTPTSDGAMFFFMTEDLKFGPEFLGRVRVVTAVASLFGVWLYNQYLKSKPIKDILFWSSIVSTPLGLLNLLLISHVNRDLGIPDTWFVFGDDVVLSVLGEIAFLPTLVLAARLCPPGVEAVLFATLMSINNGAGTLGTELANCYKRNRSTKTKVTKQQKEEKFSAATMTVKEDYGKQPEEEITVDAVPAQADTGPPIPPGHQRFYCEKCRAPYDLPQGSTSWRCVNCSTFNSITPKECPWCVVM
ncbi:folate/biopterin transporter [Nitzschia inconspicua]|uniref:Folate/biopterin transporter n=1 Tax=Nitzschia inconspicua TaxID=303405 RepID=A0A9K3Q065_9STRA|nr:folate/biopterin transporter [Nitzschia inconspicua]